MASKWQTPGTDSFRTRGGERSDEAGLDRQAKLWATPPTQDAANNGGPSQALRKTAPLNKQACLWPTPLASDGSRGDRRADGERGASLVETTKNWQTPLAVDADGPKMQRSGDNPRPSLRALVDSWPTPTTRDAASAARHTTATGVMHPGTMLTDAIRSFRSSRPPPEISTDGPPSSKSRPVLNPRFVAMLMGWPIDWTNCTCSATAAYRSWLRSHSAAFYAICSEDDR